MSDIVERLRDLAPVTNAETRAAMTEAAAEIERLQTALNRLADEPFSDLESVRAFVCSVLRRNANE